MITNASLPRVYPRIINPVAISVPDLKEAVNWYTEVCGFTVVKQATEFVVDDSLKGKAVKDIHGPRLKKMRMAWYRDLRPTNLTTLSHLSNLIELGLTYGYPCQSTFFDRLQLK
ncbi:MAG: VOC family protein [Nitrososphaeraceae archaeon]